ncbi:MAG: hypothetical protein QF902_12250 [Rhodospirillales bacterium]|nr:hypothetical protein [Rhodospirillales bacterium]
MALVDARAEAFSALPLEEASDLMSELHVICQRRLYLTRIDDSTYESAYWPATVEDARRLVGGMIYLHETKASRSYFGGVAKSYREADAESPHPRRLIFTFQPTQDGRGKSWRGRDDSMAWVGGVIE